MLNIPINQSEQINSQRLISKSGKIIKNLMGQKRVKLPNNIISSICPHCEIIHEINSSSPNT